MKNLNVNIISITRILLLEYHLNPHLLLLPLIPVFLTHARAHLTLHQAALLLAACQLLPQHQLCSTFLSP